jgi:hypothetical protein
MAALFMRETSFLGFSPRLKWRWRAVNFSTLAKPWRG